MIRQNADGIEPRLIAFEVTRKCKFNCLHCRACACDGNNFQLSSIECKNILKSLASYHKCVVILTGGEPMERSDIYELVAYGRSLGLRMVMASCGYLIDDRSLAELKQAGLMAISFSMDGASADTNDLFRGATGAFDAVVNASGAAMRAEIPFQINTTVCKLNLNELNGISRLAVKLGAYCFNPFILVPTGRGRQLESEILDPVEYEEVLNELLQIKRELPIEVRVTCGPQFARVCLQEKAEKLSGSMAGCMGGKGFGFISFKGDVQICGFLDISAGNLIENNFNFEQIWTGSEFLNQIRDRTKISGKCQICDFKNVCGGCRARAFGISGDYMGSDPVCDHNAGKAD